MFIKNYIAQCGSTEISVDEKWADLTGMSRLGPTNRQFNNKFILIKNRSKKLLWDIFQTISSFGNLNKKLHDSNTKKKVY